MGSEPGGDEGGEVRVVNEAEEFLACKSSEEQIALLARRFEEYSGRLGRSVKLRLDPRLAKRFSVRDVLQDTYLIAQERIAAYVRKPQMPLFVWLRFLALQQVKTLYRKNVKTQKNDLSKEVPLVDSKASSPGAGVVVPADAKSPSRVAMDAERVDRFREAIERMSPADRELILLRHFEDLSWAEIAHIIHIEEGAARQRHARAMVRFREALRFVVQERSAFWR